MQDYNGKTRNYNITAHGIRSGISGCAWGAEDFAACVAVPWAFGWPGQLTTNPTNAGSAPGINAGLNYGFRAQAQVFESIANAFSGETVLGLL
jgi:hypothetical protein